MTVKSFFLTMGAGVAVGALGAMMLPKNSDAYRRFFAFLSQEHYLDMLVLAYRVPGERNFTADFASRQLGIEESEAERILDHMYQTRMLQRSEIRLADRILYAYARHDETLIVPFLYFAGELLDVDAYTGGFNLQIAWATGRLAGLSAAAKEFSSPEDAT